VDILSHGLWGAIVFGRKNKKSFWKSFLWGVMPDLLSFGIFTPLAFFGIVKSVNWHEGPPSPDQIPQFVHTLYNLTHSFVIFALVFGIVFYFTKKPMLEMLAWPLHISVDIFTHGVGFFPTPFLWPFLDYRFDGIPWSHPSIFFTNWALLAVCYGLFFVYRKKNFSKNNK
jgi:hypothetical protein